MPAATPPVTTPPPKPVGVVPGNSWYHEHLADKIVHRHDVIAWIVYDDGSARPICAHATGVSFTAGTFIRPDPAGDLRLTLED